MEGHGAGRSSGPSTSKRLRSWDVDVSLDELVEWDALEQFMQEMPVQEGGARPASGVPRIGSGDIHLSALGARGLGPMGCGGIPRSISTDSARVTPDDSISLHTHASSSTRDGTSSSICSA